MTVDTLDYDQMDTQQLQDIQQKVHTALTKRKREQISAVYQQIIDIVKSNGLTVEELIEFSQKKSKKSASSHKRQVAAKYRHPDNASLTWTGRGKQPRWVVDALASGLTLEGLTIQGE